MQLAAQEELFSTCSDPCVFFPLAAFEGVGENSRLGSATRKTALHRGGAWSNSAKALGIEEVLVESRGGCRSSGNTSGVGAFSNAAKDLSKKKLDKKNCQKDLAALGVSADQIRSGASAANIINGVGSTVPLSSLYATSPNPLVQRNANSVPGTVGSFFASNPGAVAVSQLGGSNIYVNPGLINPGNYFQNLGTAFHEVVHNVSGLTDSDIQRALGLEESPITNNITQKLIRDCL